MLLKFAADWQWQKVRTNACNLSNESIIVYIAPYKRHQAVMFHNCRFSTCACSTKDQVWIRKADNKKYAHVHDGCHYPPYFSWFSTSAAQTIRSEFGWQALKRKKQRTWRWQSMVLNPEIIFFVFMYIELGSFSTKQITNYIIWPQSITNWYNLTPIYYQLSSGLLSKGYRRLRWGTEFPCCRSKTAHNSLSTGWRRGNDKYIITQLEL